MYDIKRDYISINQHEECRKYYIPNDNYHYEFFNYNSFNAEKDYCLSIGSCSFYPLKEDETFRYDLYMKYLNKHFGIIKNKGIIFSNFLTKVYSKDNERLNPIDVIDAKMDIKMDDLKSCSKVWNMFKYYTTPLSPEDFENRFYQAKKLNIWEMMNMQFLNLDNFNKYMVSLCQ